MQPILRSVVTALASTIIVVIILAAVALGLARLLLPMASQYRAEIAQQISESLGRPVTIGALDASWQGMNPYLRLKDVRVLDKEAARTLLRFADVQIGVNIPYYMRHGRLERGSLKVSGTTLSVIRRADGSIVLKGFEQQTAKGQFMNWLLSQDQLSLEASQIYWTDQQAQSERLHFTGVNLSLRSNGRRHQVDGALSLAGARGRPVNFALDFTGRLTDLTQWNGKFYAQGIGLDLARWLTTPTLLGNQLIDGQANFRLWGEWASGNLQGLQGEVATQDLQFTNAQGQPAAFTLGAVSGQLHWQRARQGWLLDVAQLTIEQGDVPSAPGQLRVRSFGEDDPLQIDARFKLLPIQDLSTLLLTSDALSPELHDALKAMNPRGELHDLHLRLQGGDADQATSDQKLFNNFYIETRLTDLVTQVWKDLPAVQNIDALLRADERSGMMELDSRLAKLELTKIIRSPIKMNVLSGRLNWRHMTEGWRLEADGIRAKNADISVGLNGTVDLPVNQSSPFLNLRVGFENGNIANLDGYLPFNHIPPKALHWLEKSLVNGRVTSGSALIHGLARDFPFKSNQGSFETTFNAIGGVIDYKSEWPQVESLAATVMFRGQGMELDALGGAIFGTEILQAHTTIPDLTADEPQLMLQGKARGSSTDALRFLKEGPLKDKFTNYVSGLSASGESVVDLDLLIPIKQGKNRVKGILEMTNSTLNYAGKNKDADIELNQINGALNFTETDFAGKDIAAMLRGQAVRLNVSTPTSGQKGTGQALVIDAHGEISAEQLAAHVKQAVPNVQPGLLDRFDGATDWSGSLKFNEGADTGLTLESDLQGMVVNLPAPIGKTATEAIPLLVKTSLSNKKSRRYTISYGERLDAVFKISQTGKTFELMNGAVKFGGVDEALALPPTGLRISGSLPRFSLDAWNDVFPSASNSTPSGVMQKLAGIDVNVATLEAFNQEFTAARIEATKTAQQWSLNLNSDQVIGTVTLPQDTSVPWVMDFERLHLAKSADEDTLDSSFDPRRLPPLRVSSKSFQYGEADLGQLTLETAKRSSGMHVDVLKLQTPEMTVTGQGDWLIEGGGQVTRFDFEVESKELGKSLTTLGYDTNIAGGNAHIDLTAHWTGAPMDFALARLNGTLSMKIEKGRFLDINPGAGRVFGLLSIQALPRRLSLDFSDLFQKGFAFDSITSEFALKDGNAYTSNLLMKGPSAIISVTGRTGLAAKDYDQVVTVKPQIGASLPLAATIAGGPVAGAAVFLAQKIFQPQIDDITGYQYTIKGTWDDPNIDRVNAKASSTGQ